MEAGRSRDRSVYYAAFISDELMANGEIRLRRRPGERNQRPSEGRTEVVRRVAKLLRDGDSTKSGAAACFAC